MSTVRKSGKTCLWSDKNIIFSKVDGKLSAPKNIVKPNSYVILESLIDTICVVSSCPFDITPDDWEINSGGVVTELEVEI